MTQPNQTKIDQLLQAHRAGYLDAAILRELLTNEGLSHAEIDALLTAAADAPPAAHVSLSGGGAVAQGAAGRAAGERGVVTDSAHTVQTGDHARAIDSDKYVEKAGTVIFAQDGSRIVVGEEEVVMSAVERDSALGHYLQHMISRNRYLQLQGIRSGGKLVHIELDRIYIRLRARQERLVPPDTLAEQGFDDQWLVETQQLAPGELHRRHAAGEPQLTTETVTISVEEALAQHPRLVVLGDPGSGKTTLTRYLALLYAQDLAQQSTRALDILGETIPKRLPILLPLRQIGAFLRNRADEGTDGHDLLLQFLFQALRSERIALPADFFDDALNSGRALLLLDGLDEVADPQLRRRVARLVERFTAAYPDCRSVVTSRIVGYEGAARLGEGFVTTTVRDFSLADVEQFLTNWHTLLAVGQLGPEADVTAYAADQTAQLMAAVRHNDRIRELAINPLMLTVIALVHRDRVKLPDRRAELYAEAVDVLLGKWDEARGVQEIAILENNQPFDAGDRRLMLQAVALHMHEAEKKELEQPELETLLTGLFYDMTGDTRTAQRAVERFMHVIRERTGLLVARGEGVYAFSHLTFQEYLTALELTGQEEYVSELLRHSADPWWREVILLAAGHLSMTSKSRTTSLIQALADRRDEPQPYHNLVLAAACLRDVGSGRVQGNLAEEVQGRLRQDINTDISQMLTQYRQRPVWQRQLTRWVTGVPADEKSLLRDIIERRSAAMEALAQAGGGFWSLPHGEPEWVHIPAGQFWMGSDKTDAGSYDEEHPLHQIHLDAFYIAKTPVTNAQYLLFVRAANHQPPGHWEDNRPPKGLESHPVVNVTWHDTMAFCTWLCSVTGKTITLPSEAQWERAARGSRNRRIYP